MAEFFETTEYGSQEVKSSPSKRKRLSFPDRRWEPPFGAPFKHQEFREKGKSSEVGGKKLVYFGDGASSDISACIFERDTYPEMVTEPDSVMREALAKNQHVRCQDALNYYSFKNKGSDYKVVEVVKHYDMHRMPYSHTHYNFKARAVVKGREDRDDDDDDGSVLFYADFWEYIGNHSRRIAVLQCQIVDPSGPVGNCRICQNGVVHPEFLVEPEELPPFWMNADPLPDHPSLSA